MFWSHQFLNFAGVSFHCPANLSRTTTAKSFLHKV
jgi:hypothetical protein